MKKDQFQNLEKFRHAIVAVDTVMFAIEAGVLKTLLLQIKLKPLTGKWAVPGGLVLPTEDLEEAVLRQVRTKTGTSGNYSEQLFTFGDLQRDPRGRVVSVAHLSLLPALTTNLAIHKDYSAIQWFDVRKLPAMAYDHKKIIAMAHERLRAKIGYTNIAQFLLAPRFTLSELQQVYEIVLSHSLDKRNFRKKILTLDIITETKEKQTGGFRPAQLYRFKDKKITLIEVL